jgi:catechol 2,3-dioxygenase-like lactoylglutathione lyase family enzyme
MRIIKLAWVGTRTDNAEPTVAFFRDVLGLRLELDQPGFWMLKLPDNSKVEVFGPDSPINRHFTTGRSPASWPTTSRPQPPSCGPPAWRSSLRQRWTTAATLGSTFAPRTGNIYELTQDPGVARPH